MIFDVENPPSEPDSELDPDVSKEQVYEIAGGKSVKIAPGDWVDIDVSMITPDENWGFSFQVSNVYEFGVVGILIKNQTLQIYEETSLSASLITNNFRRVADEVAE